MTLKDFYQQRRDRLLTRRDDARTALDAALTTASAARDGHRAATSAVAAAADAITATRQAMAQAPLPVDAEALADRLGEEIIDHRRRHRLLLDAEETLAAADADRAAASAELAAASAELARAETALVEAQEDADRHAQRLAALAAPPLADLATDAGNELTGDVFTAAQTRVEGDVPTKLRSRALERGTRQRARLDESEATADHATAQADAQRKTDGGAAGQLDELWTAYRAADRGLRDYADRGLARLEGARQRLTSIVSTPELTAEQRAEIEDADDLAAREAAADAEADRDLALAAVEQKRRELEQQRLEVKAGDVDLSANDVDADPAVDAILTDLGDAGDPATLEGELAAAEDALDAGDPSPREVLETWEAAVPDPIWANLASFQTAETTLQTLAAGPGTLETDRDAAEDALAQALTTHDKSVRTRDHLRAAATARRGRYETARNLQPRRLASEIRGDLRKEI